MKIRPIFLLLLTLTLVIYGLQLVGVQFYPSPKIVFADAAQNPTINAAATSTIVDVPDISKTPTSQIAIRQKLLAMLDPTDPNSVFTVVDTIEANKPLSLSCHELAHDIGHKAFELYGFSGAMNFSDAARMRHASVQDICAGGYVHGILEEASLHQPDFAEHPGAMCEGVANTNRASCFHGVGHALMFTYFRDESASLAGCRIVGTADDISRCFEGVWMEFFWGDTKYSGPDTLGWDTNKPLDPCIATQQDAKAACFIYSAFGYLRTHKHDYSGAVTLCTQSNLTGSDSGYCMKGVGITMISHLQGTHLEQSEPFVEGSGFEEKYAFYEGVMGYAKLSGISPGVLTAACRAMKEDADICLAALSLY